MPKKKKKQPKKVVKKRKRPLPSKKRMKRAKKPIKRSVKRVDKTKTRRVGKNRNKKHVKIVKRKSNKREKEKKSAKKKRVKNRGKKTNSLGRHKSRKPAKSNVRKSRVKSRHKFFSIKKSAPQVGRKKVRLSWVPQDQIGYGYKIPFKVTNGIAGINPLLIAALGDKFRKDAPRGLAQARLIVTYTVKVGKKTYKKTISVPRENLDLPDWFLRLKDSFDSLNYAVHGYDEMVYTGNDDDEGEEVNKRTIKIQIVLLELVNVAREKSIEL